MKTETEDKIFKDNSCEKIDCKRCNTHWCGMCKYNRASRDFRNYYQKGGE